MLVNTCGMTGQRQTVSASGAGFPYPVRRRSGALCAALSALLACPAGAAKWDIVPTLSIEETYTDNVRLTAPGSERGDWVTTLNPGLAVRGSGDRLRLDFVYAPLFLHRAREGSNDVIHQLNASATAEFIKRTLFLDVRSTVSQQNISILGPQADSNINITGNRESVRSTLISPVLRHDFGLHAQGEARLSYSTVSTGSGTIALSDSQATGLDVKINSGPTSKLFTWNAAYSRQHIDYNELQVQDIDTQRITTGAKRLITPQVGLLANLGYEDNSYLTTGQAPKGAFWNVGSDWNPTPRTRFAATAGRNYDGSTASFDFSHCTRLTVWTASYVQDITTTHTQILVPASEGTAGRVDGLYQCTIPDPVARQTAVSAFMDQNGPPPSFGAQVGFNVSVPYLVKRLQGSIGIRGVRNTMFANLFTQSREAKGPLDQPGAGDFEQSARIKDSGASVLWTSRLSAQTAFYLNVGFTRNEFVATGFVDKQKFIRLGMTRQFHPRLSGTVSYHRIQNDSSNNAAAYTENAVSAALTVRF